MPYIQIRYKMSGKTQQQREKKDESKEDRGRECSHPEDDWTSVYPDPTQTARATAKGVREGETAGLKQSKDETARLELILT